MPNQPTLSQTKSEDIKLINFRDITTPTADFSAFVQYNDWVRKTKTLLSLIYNTLRTLRALHLVQET